MQSIILFFKNSLLSKRNEEAREKEVNILNARIPQELECPKDRELFRELVIEHWQIILCHVLKSSNGMETLNSLRLSNSFFRNVMDKCLKVYLEMDLTNKQCLNYLSMTLSEDKCTRVRNALIERIYGRIDTSMSTIKHITFQVRDNGKREYLNMYLDEVRNYQWKNKDLYEKYIKMNRYKCQYLEVLYKDWRERH